MNATPRQAEESSHSEELKLFVWAQAKTAEPLRPELYRYDSFGYLISYHHFGNRDKALGWVIEHSGPACATGMDEPQNLQALNFKNSQANRGRIACRTGQT